VFKKTVFALLALSQIAFSAPTKTITGNVNVTGVHKTGSGVVGTPGQSWVSEPTSGWYRENVNDFRFSIAGADALRLKPAASYFPAGTETLPGISILPDPDSGWFQISDNKWGFSLGGSKKLDIDGSYFATSLPIEHPNGTAGSPSITFLNGHAHGVYSSAGNVVNITSAGVDRFLVNTSTNDSRQLVNIITGGLTNPSFSDGNDSLYIEKDGIYSQFDLYNTNLGTPVRGIYSINRTGTSNGMGSTVAGLNMFTVTNQPIRFGSFLTQAMELHAGQIRCSGGTAGAPCFTGKDDLDSGWYNVSDNVWGFSLGGNEKLRVDSDYFYVSGSGNMGVEHQPGTVSKPSMTFSNGHNHGVYSSGTNVVDVTTSSVNRMSVSDAGVALPFPTTLTDQGSTPSSPAASKQKAYTKTSSDHKLFLLNSSGAEHLVGSGAVARYKTGAGQSIPDNSATILDCETSVFDTDSRVTTGAAWKFTSNRDGYYRAAAVSRSAAGAGWDPGEQWEMTVYKNGTIHTVLGTHISETTNSTGHGSGGSALVFLASGDYVDFRILQTTGAARGVNADANQNWCEVEFVR